MNLSQLQGEERRLLARLDDLAQISGEKYIPRFTSFLNERQALIACEYIRQSKLENTLLYGGYPDAQRKAAGFFPPYTTPDTAGFPFSAVDIRFRAGEKLTHRDVLGALMSLGLKRESVGDLLLSDGLCTVFLLDTVADTVLRDLQKVGGAGVRCEVHSGCELVSEQEFRELTGTLHSLRMDSLVALLASCSREKSAALIRAELVQREYVTVDSGSRAFGQGDHISIRGYGKFVVDEIGSPTRKGRLPVRVRRYL